MKYNAYNGSQERKDLIVSMAENHTRLDEYRRGIYGKEVDGKFIGCAVGCAIYDVCKIDGIDDFDVSDHDFLAEKLDVPVFITRLQNLFFENCSQGLRKSWPVDILSAINPGSDLNSVLPKFLLYLISDVKKDLTATHFERQLSAVENVKDVLNNWTVNGSVDIKAAKAAVRAAESASWASWAATEATARAAWATESAAWAAWAAAESAAWAATEATARAAWAAESAEAAAFDDYAKKLLSLIKDCK